MLPVTIRDSHRSSSQAVLSTALRLLRRRLRIYVRRNCLRIAVLLLVFILWVAAQNFLQTQGSRAEEIKTSVLTPPTHRPSNSSRTLAQYIGADALPIEGPGTKSFPIVLVPSPPIHPTKD